MINTYSKNKKNINLTRLKSGLNLLHSSLSLLKERLKFISNIRYLIFILIFAAGSGAAYYFYLHTYKTGQPLAKQEDTAALVAHIGRLIILPQNEEPTIATVADPELLKTQPFFAGAKKGDKVLIYNNAKKAILYDPVNNIIINVAPINIGAPPGE